MGNKNYLVLIVFIELIIACTADGTSIVQLTEPMDHGETPTWDPRTNLLYFVDMFLGRVYSYNPETGRKHFISFDGVVATIIKHKTHRDHFYISLNRTLLKITWDGHHKVAKIYNITTVSHNFPLTTLNDGKADKQGRLWIGTQGFILFDNHSPVTLLINESSLYFFTKQNYRNPSPVITPVNISNGLAWNKANDKFFYIDSITQSVVQYDYNDADGAISNRKVVVDFHSLLLGKSGAPDGMTIDAEDNLWVALIGTGFLVHVNSTDGTIIKQIAMPAKYVTSCIWGGRKLDSLFVTTSKRLLSNKEKLQQPAAGALFVVRGLGTRGFPLFLGDI